MKRCVHGCARVHAGVDTCYRRTARHLAPSTGLLRRPSDPVIVVPQDYYRRYKVCLKHASSPMVMLRGIPQRFCQQCGTFHPIGEFDADKRCVSPAHLLTRLA